MDISQQGDPLQHESCLFISGDPRLVMVSSNDEISNVSAAISARIAGSTTSTPATSISLCLRRRRIVGGSTTSTSATSTSRR